MHQALECTSDQVDKPHAYREFTRLLPAKSDHDHVCGHVLYDEEEVIFEDGAAIMDRLMRVKSGGQAQP